jgi:hypothetical protein
MQHLKRIYLQLVSELTIINSSPLPCLERSELSFRASLVTFQKLSLALQQNEWQPRQWICINKKIRAEVIALSEYFLLLHHALLFQPPDQQQAIIFWKREQKRLAAFRSSYAAFYQYYKSYNSDKDLFYFKSPSLHYYPGNSCCKPKGDVLQGKLNALLLYHSFVQHQISLLKKGLILINS